MNKLKEEIKHAVIACDFTKKEIVDGIEQDVYQPEAIAEAAAKVSKRWIEEERKRIWDYLKVRTVHINYEHGDVVQIQHIARVLNGNGLTEPDNKAV